MQIIHIATFHDIGNICANLKPIWILCSWSSYKTQSRFNDCVSHDYQTIEMFHESCMIICMQIFSTTVYLHELQTLKKESNLEFRSQLYTNK